MFNLSSDIYSFNPPLTVTFPTISYTDVRRKSKIKRPEIVRENIRKLYAYVEEIASGDDVSGALSIQKVRDDVLNL